MKKILVLVFLIPLLGHSQLPLKEGRVFYEVVDSAITGTSGQLFDKSKTWMVDAFKDAKEVIQLQEKENGTLIGKGIYRFTHTMMPYSIHFTVKINTKDNKYRLQVYDLLAGWNNTNDPLPIERWLDKKSAKKWLEKADEGIRGMIKNFQKSMSKKSDNDF